MMSSNCKWSPLREHLAEFTRCETGMSRTASRGFVSGFFRVLAEYVRTHDVAEVRGFGSFRWVTCRPRKCTGGLFGRGTIPGYRKLTFHSQAIKRERT